MSTIKPRTAVVTIYQGDYLDRIRHLERQAEALKEAETADGPRLNSDVPAYLEKAREHDDLVKEAEEDAIHVRVTALGRRVWKALIAAHPPRTTPEVDEKTARGDALLGVNADTFTDALVYGGMVTIDGEEVPYRSVIEPDLTGDDLDTMADGDYDRIFWTAFGLNRTAPTDPKASLVSRLTQTSDETSN